MFGPVMRNPSTPLRCSGPGEPSARNGRLPASEILISPRFVKGLNAFASPPPSPPSSVFGTAGPRSLGSRTHPGRPSRPEKPVGWFSFLPSLNFDWLFQTACFFTVFRFFIEALAPVRFNGVTCPNFPPITINSPKADLLPDINR